MTTICLDDFFKAALRSEGKEFMKAQQFFKDQQPWPEGVSQIKGCLCSNPDCDCQSDPAYILETPDGTVLIEDGDWIVQSLDNTRYYVRIKPEPVE